MARLNAALPGERRGVLMSHVGDEVASVLGFASGEQIDPERGLNELGLDSLMAVELRNRLESSLGVFLSPTVAFDYPSIEALTEYLSKDVLKLETAPEPQGAADGNGTRASMAAEIERLSEDEALDLLLDELKLIDEKL
jgi:myxalamid-type polyketide synthase MxaB